MCFRSETIHEKAYRLLERTVHMEKLSEAERGGLIQFFEMTFEMAWKLMKDYMEAQGLITKSPREAIKMAIQYDLIRNPHDWMDALDDRNLTVHTYDEATALEVEQKIKKVYFKLLGFSIWKKALWGKS